MVAHRQAATAKTDEPDATEVAEQRQTELLLFVTPRIIREIPRQ